MSLELFVLLAAVVVVLYIRSENRLKRIEGRIRRLEEAAAAGTPLADTLPTADDSVEVEAAETGQPGPWGATAEDVPADAETSDETLEPIAARTEAEETVAETKPRESLESRIGARWPVWVGGLALGLGGIFMVKYSIESGLLSPAVRLSLAFLFGLGLLAGGEWLRRRETPLDIPAIRNAMIPGVLTAAGVVTLFGAVFAANSIYGYIGAGVAFALLAFISLSAIALSLLHGQAFAGLGLLASMITPALIDSDAPNAWGLFGYLSVAWLATNLASRIRRWNAVPAFANIMLMLWALLAILDTMTGAVPAVMVSQLVMIAGLVFLWSAASGEEPWLVEEPEEGEEAAAPSIWRRWYDEAIRNTGHLWLKWSGALAALMVANSYLVVAVDEPLGYGSFAIITGALALWAAWRSKAAPAAIAAAFGVFLAAGQLLVDFVDAWDGPMPDEIQSTGWGIAGDFLVENFLLAAAFVAFGVLAVYRHSVQRAAYTLGWAFLMTGAPLILLSSSYIGQGTFAFDWPHGLAGLVLAAFYLALAEWLSRNRSAEPWIDEHIGVLVIGSFLSLVLTLHAFTDSIVTTILTAVAGFAYLFAIRFRAWPILPWIMGLAGIVVLARIGWQPSLVGDLSLSKTPFFNQLLPGYGIPAVLMGIGAYLVRDWPAERARNFLQAMASLMVLMTLAVLVRHALNGGSLSGGAPSLGEQSIYTLLTVGGSAVLMTLDMKSPSPVFRWGSMLVGGISLLSALTAHLGALNPYFSGELTGKYPLFNLLLLGYLLPAIAYFGLAFYARGKRPMPYVRALAIGGAVLAFAWVTLSVRRYWQGPGLADWKGFMQSEMYTYSVVWLVFGVALLAIGSRFNAVSLRLASAALVLVAVLKVFLIDMSNLEGFLRALSFIGLGGVLIGIGLFYQRVLARRPAEEGQ